mmetsp:Transcript_10724/g.44584  ORF Transcript_10724/g.44584 Transcript_10724/m.44584 type:complete len:909 (-) Transcript_10724:84-2810(-)
MMVKPADADGDAEMNVVASTHATVEPAVERETSNEEEEEEDAMDALLGVGREIGDDAAHGRDDRAADDDAPAAGDAGDDDEDMDEDDTAEGSPERKPEPEARADDMDESAKMLMLLGELGGDEEDDLADDASDDDGDGSSPAKITPSKRKKPERPSANGHGVGAGGDGALAATQSGPVGEWLKAEGEARMKMADHRRLIYRWTNAIYRLLGMKIPRGMGSLFDKGEKNKREKFDRFLSYYYGTETFEPGTYWYNNADTIQFFIELVRIATCNRTVLEPITIQKLFRKKDPTRQASTWIMVQEELDKTNVTAAELRALFEGPPRMENGFPRGRPLFVPIPKNPKGHHKYNRGDGGGESVPPSPAPPPRERPAREKRPSTSAKSSKQTAPTATASAAPNMANFQAMAAAAGMANVNPGFAAAAAAAAQAHAAAIHQHTAIAAGHARTFAAHEAMMRSLSAAGIPGAFNPMDPAAADAVNLAQRQNSLAALFQNGFVSQGSPGTPSASKGPPRDARVAHEAELARAEAAPGACAGVTLAPGSSPTHMPGGIVSPYDAAGAGSAGASSRLGPKRAKAGDSRADVIRRIDATPAGGDAGVLAGEADLPPAPTRLVGEILFGTLRDVVSDVFGLPTKVSEALKEDDGAIVEEGKERLMSMGELINANLPDLTAVEDDTGRAGGGREPTVDRTGVKAQVDSVIVAAKAAESTWRRFNDASLRALAAARKAKGIDDRIETARAELAGAKLARDAVTQHSMDVDPAVRAAMRATIEEKIAKANAEVASFADEHAKFLEAEAEARATANASARAFRPPYEEVRKRTLRIRLHAEERAERQIGRALSRADRDLQHKDQKLKELGFAKDPVVKPEIEENERKREIVREGRKKIKAAHEGCKSAIEWCKREIATCQTALDV